MSYTAERAAVGGVLSDWDTCPILWPSSDIDPESLAPSASPQAPTRYLVVAITREDERRIDFAKTRQVDGTVRIWVWCEQRLGDGLVESTAQELADLFEAWTPPAGWTVVDHGLGDPLRDGGFYGAELRIRFIRFEQGGTNGTSG